MQMIRIVVKLVLVVHWSLGNDHTRSLGCKQSECAVGEVWILDCW